MHCLFTHEARPPASTVFGMTWRGDSEENVGRCNTHPPQGKKYSSATSRHFTCGANNNCPMAKTHRLLSRGHNSPSFTSTIGMPQWATDIQATAKPPHPQGPAATTVSAVCQPPARHALTCTSVPRTTDKGCTKNSQPTRHVVMYVCARHTML